MEIPDLVKQRLGDEEIVSAVNLGGENVACFTPSRTLIYRSDGLLSDESLEGYDHDIQRLDVSSGRRKTAFTLEYVDQTKSFTVAIDRTHAMLERLLAGVLGTAGVLASGEGVAGVYRFSELTLIITDARLVKHIGAFVWDEDYQEYPFSDVTGLQFEEGSVATQIVLALDGRPQRIKAPSDEAPLLRETLVESLFEYYDVESLSELNEVVSQPTDNEAGEQPTADERSAADLTLDEGITPLVSGSGEESTTETASETERLEDSVTEKTTATQNRESTATQSTGQSAAEGSTQPPPPQPAIDSEEFEALQQQVSKLTTAVERQNELLKQQHETIARLTEEIQRE